jgi:sugar lactone lactonase YvrE
MLFRKQIVSTRTFLQMAVAAVFSLAAVGAASAAGPNSTTPPLLVPYTINTIAGNTQFNKGTTSLPVGYFGEGVPATPTLANQTSAVFQSPFAMAVDSVGNVYITDTANYIIREVNAQTGLVNTIAGVIPKGCSGSTCTVRTSGCDDGVPAAGARIGTHNEGIAVDAYGNVYYDDNTTATVSVIYRGGTQVANFIALVDPGGVAKSGGAAQPGYVYHVGGTINLSTCAGLLGNQDNVIAFEDSSNASAPTGAQLHGPALLTLDSAGNIYIADISNDTVRVINTQATPQTFFQYAVQPGYMRSITNCNPLTTGCPTQSTTALAYNGIDGPVNALVYNSQYKEAEVDAFGNIYQLNGTGSGTGPPGIYGAGAYAGGAPLTNLLTAEAPTLIGSYPNSATLAYGNSYIVLGNPAITSALPGSFPDLLVATNGGSFDVRPSSLLPDNFGSFWYMDNHYPELNRIDQYTSLATLILKSGRATANIAPLNNNPASFTNPYYCVYGSTSSKIAWTSGPQTYDPEGDGCPVVVATFSGGNYQTVSDGVGNIYVGDGGEQLERIITNGNAFPATAVGTPVTQPIQVHFSSTNPPQIGPAIPDVAVTGNTTTAFSIAPGISDFAIDVTDPEFPMGSLIGGSAYGQTTTTANFALYPVAGSTGLPTCTQLGAYPTPTTVSDYDCLVYVTFNPTAPGVRQSQLQVTTANGSIYYFSLQGVGTGGQLAIDGGAPTAAAVTGLGSSTTPTVGGIAVAQNGTLYVADPANNRVVVLPSAPMGGTQSNLAFTGVTPATLSGPMGVALDAAGNIYVSDTGNNRILKITPSITGTGPGVATVLGNNSWITGTSGISSSPGTTPATTLTTTPPPQYTFKAPQGIAVDKWNNVYVADTGNKAVVEITSNIALGGAVPLLNYAGAPQFVNPVGVAVDSQGNIYVADTGNPNSQVIELPPGGGDLATVPTSQFPNLLGTGLRSPAGVAVDGAGNVYVSDIGNNNVVEIPSGSGSGNSPFVINLTTMNGAGTGLTTLSNPGGLALDASGNLYIADTGNRQVLFDNRQSPMVNFGNVPEDGSTAAEPLCTGTTISDGFNIGNTAGSCVLTVSNIGSGPVTLRSPLTVVTGTPNTAYAVTNSCGSSLNPGLTCTITATFTPTATTNNQSENVTVNGNQVMSLVANGDNPLANIVLSSSGGLTPAAGTTTTISATVTQPHIAGNTPTGTVTFTYVIDAFNKNANSCGSGGTQTANLVNGVASFQLPVLAQGVQYTITANYNGDSLNTPAAAAPLLVQVPGVPVTATVTSTAAQLTFTYGGKVPVPVGTVTLSGGGSLPAGITSTFGSAATPSTPTGTYPVIVSFGGTGACAYGNPAVVYSTGGSAIVTENPAPLTYTLPNFTALYGAPNISYGVNAVTVGAVNGDGFGKTFTPPQSSILNVGTYQVKPTLTGADVGDYIVTAPSSTLTITQAPTAISVSSSISTIIAAAANFTGTTTSGSTSLTALSSTTGLYAGELLYNPAVLATGTTISKIGPVVLTGNTTNGSTTISAVSTTTGLYIGDPVTGSGLAAGTTVSAISNTTITLSAAATASATGVTFTAATTITLSTAATAAGTGVAIAAGEAADNYSISVGTTVARGIGIPTGSVTVTDNFTPITPTGYGTPAAPTTVVVPLVAGIGSFNPTQTSPTPSPGIHQYSFAYSGDSNFQPSTLALASNVAACLPSAITANCLITDTPDFFLSSNSGPVAINPGTVPSGNGLLSAPNQSTAYPETAVMLITAVNGFVGTVNLSCQTQNPSYVNCFMTPLSVCFASTASLACPNASTSAASVVAISTPANLPLGFKTSQVQMSATKTVLAFVPFGVLAFCVRRRRRLSNALWMLIGIVAIGAGMTGCGGNQVAFYTPIPTGPQSVTVTASYPGNGTNQPAETRQFIVPIAID